MERMETQLLLTISRPLELQVQTNRPGSIEGQPFEFGLRSIIVHELGSSKKGSKNPTS
jgi:hypothetical protein